MLSRARALYYEFQFSMIGFPWYISFLLLFMSILVEVLLLEKGNHFTKKLSLPYAQAFKTDVIFTLTKRPPEKNVSQGFSSSYLLRKETVVFSLMQLHHVEEHKLLHLMNQDLIFLFFKGNQVSKCNILLYIPFWMNKKKGCWISL